MKKFNEWLSFRSNSYQENEESQSAFEFEPITGIKNPSGVGTTEQRFKGMLDRYGGEKNVKNKRLLLASLIKDIYDFSDPKQMNKIKIDLRYLLNKLEMNNNLENVKDEEEERDDEEI